MVKELIIYCPSCSGSGEGYSPGIRCSECRGIGEIPFTSDEDDEEENDD